MAVNTELLELLRQLINDESATIFTDDELEQILERCDEDINRAAAWCALIRANKVAEDLFTPPDWPNVPSPPAVPTLPSPPSWPALPDEPTEIATYLNKAEDFAQLLSDYENMGGHLSISEIVNLYRQRALMRREIWERERDDLIQQYRAEYERWERQCDHLLREWDGQVRIWAQQVSDMAQAGSQRNDRARLWQEQARGWSS